MYTISNYVNILVGEIHNNETPFMLCDVIIIYVLLCQYQYVNLLQSVIQLS